MRLVAFDSCEQLRTDLRKATRAAVGPYGLPGSMSAYAVPEFARDSALKSRLAVPVPAAGSYSGSSSSTTARCASSTPPAEN
jgi:hypothetical protein